MAKGSVDEAYYYSSRHEEERARHLLENVKQKRPRHRKRRTTVLDCIEPCQDRFVQQLAEYGCVSPG